IVGVAVGHDDPTWLKLTAWLGDFDQTYAFPKACFVSFGDVVELWKSGEARSKCKRDWNEIMANFLPKEKRFKRMKEIHAKEQKQAEIERKKKGKK
ncbi:MAG: hypothetical protein RID07_04225, partial [Lacipirellulaceae bacterium]